MRKSKKGRGWGEAVQIVVPNRRRQTIPYLLSLAFCCCTCAEEEKRGKRGKKRNERSLGVCGHFNGRASLFRKRRSTPRPVPRSPPPPKKKKKKPTEAVRYLMAGLCLSRLPSGLPVDCRTIKQLRSDGHQRLADATSARGRCPRQRAAHLGMLLSPVCRVLHHIAEPLLVIGNGLERLHMLAWGRSGHPMALSAPMGPGMVSAREAAPCEHTPC